MAIPSVLIAGCGDVGGRLARQLLAQNWTVFGLRRSIQYLPAGVLPVAADLVVPQLPLTWPSGPLEYLVYCAAASESSEAMVSRRNETYPRRIERKRSSLRRVSGSRRRNGRLRLMVRSRTCPIR